MEIKGYASLTSVCPGGNINFHLRSDAPVTSPTVFTVYRFGSTAISTTFSAVVNNQPYPQCASANLGFNWQPTFTFNVPSTWQSGLYRVKYYDGTRDVDIMDFVVTDLIPGKHSKILFQICFNTPQAYNASAGKSLYGFNSWPSNNESSRANMVSFDRTVDLIDYETYMINWLEAEGIDVEYCTSIDLHDNSKLLSNYDLLLIVGHDEYWSKEMRDNVEAFIKNGGNFAIFSGNTCYRQVRFEQPNHRTMIFYKYAANDPSTENERVTVAFSEPPVNRSQNIMLGVGFTHGAFGNPGQSYEIRFPSHWVFAGVNGITLGSGFLTYETDAAAFVEEDEGYPRVTGEEGTPLNFLILATADLTASTKPGMATMGIFTRNGTVFNAATTDWVKRLTGTTVDPNIKKITKNVINRLKNRRVWDWEEIGHANYCTGMTSLNGKLYVSTNDNRLWQRFPVGADINWRHIGHANYVCALAAGQDKLFCATTANKIWWRRDIVVEENWHLIGDGPQNGVKALAIAGAFLYANDSQGVLQVSPLDTNQLNWGQIGGPSYPFSANSKINAMTSYSDILFATTSDNRLIRTNKDFIYESTGWIDLHSANFSVGLAVIESMLFAATSQNKLLWMDIYGLRKP